MAIASSQSVADSAAESANSDLDRRLAVISHPISFSETLLGHDPWPGAKRIMSSILDNSRTAVKACHSSSKTFTAAEAAIWWVTRYLDGIVVTTAPTWTQVEKLLWGEVHKALDGSRIVYPECLKTELRLGPSRYAMGLSTNKGVKFQGFHGQILIIIDEAPGVEADIWEAIEGIRAGGNVHVLALGNPVSIGGPFYDAFGPNRWGWNSQTISCFDIPNFWLHPDDVPFLVAAGLCDASGLRTLDPSARVSASTDLIKKTGGTLSAVLNVVEGISRALDGSEFFVDPLSESFAEIAENRSLDGGIEKGLGEDEETGIHGNGGLTSAVSGELPLPARESSQPEKAIPPVSIAQFDLETCVSSEPGRATYHGGFGEGSHLYGVWHPDDLDRLEATRNGIPWETGFPIRSLTIEELIALPSERVSWAPRPYLTLRSWVVEKWHEWGPGDASFEARCLGNFPKQSQNALLPLAYLESAQLRTHLECQARDGGSEKAVWEAGIDVAGPGENETVLTIRNGSYIFEQVSWPQQDPRGEAVEILKKYQHLLLSESIKVDAVGMGYYFALHLQDTFGDRVVLVNVGEKSSDPEKYVNLKAELYWGLRMRGVAGDFGGLSNECLSQLSTVTYKHTPRGQVIVESKAEMAKRGIVSPDKAESVMLAFAKLTYIPPVAAPLADEIDGLVKVSQWDPSGSRARERELLLPGDEGFSSRWL